MKQVSLFRLRLYIAAAGVLLLAVVACQKDNPVEREQMMNQQIAADFLALPANADSGLVRVAAAIDAENAHRTFIPRWVA